MQHSLFDLTGKVAIVTGASRGLGQTFARALARAGADLAITSRTLDSLTTFQNEVEAMGRRSVPLELDVRDEGSIRRMVDRKSTRLNSSHGYISYAVFCLKKKKQQNKESHTQQH